jgi:hypothetical protein
MGLVDYSTWEKSFLLTLTNYDKIRKLCYRMLIVKSWQYVKIIFQVWIYYIYEMDDDLVID